MNNTISYLNEILLRLKAKIDKKNAQIGIMELDRNALQDRYNSISQLANEAAEKEEKRVSEYFKKI